MQGFEEKFLLGYIKQNSYSIWVSGIRKDQTPSRMNSRFIDVTDLNAIKISPLVLGQKMMLKLLKNNSLRFNHSYFDMCKANDSREWAFIFSF